MQGGYTYIQEAEKDLIKKTMSGTIYTKDILRGDFEQCDIKLKDDYEGYAVATLIRCMARGYADKAVLYVHGFNDYFFQEEMAHRFNGYGFNFYAVDLRKYGRSYRQHQTFNSIRNLKAYYEEISIALEVIRREGNRETILVGHSTGGLILTLFAKDHPDSNLYDGLILNSPFFDFNLSKPMKLLLPVVSFGGRLMPRRTISGGFSEKYGESIHKEYGGEWEYDLNWKPHIAPKINLGWLRAIYNAQRELDEAFRLSKPVLVMRSENSVSDLEDMQQVVSRDAVLNVKDIERVARNIKGNVTIVAVKGGLHDLVLSRKNVREKVYAIMFEWLDGNNL